MAKLELLICIINEPQLLDSILEAFFELEVQGATVVDSRGMGEILTTEVPLFTGLKTLFPGGGNGNNMIFSVMTSEKVEQIVPVIDEICSDFDAPGVGFMFTLPVNWARGSRKPVKDGSDSKTDSHIGEE